MIQRNKLILKKIKQETEDTKTLFFVLKNGKKLEFKAGQYLNLFFEGKKMGKPYTISSSPDEDEIGITVKKQKDFSVQLHEMKVGDEILAVGPLGFLTLSEIDETDREKNLVFLAAGIGITPFFSILQSEEIKIFKRNISLFYASRQKESTIFFQELEKIQQERGNFNLFHFWSQKQNKLNIKKIQEKLGSLENKIYFIVGSVSFVRDFRNGLKEQGVVENDIFTEAFF